MASEHKSTARNRFTIVGVLSAVVLIALVFTITPLIPSFAALVYSDDFSTDNFTNGGGTKFTVNTITEVFDFDSDQDGVADWEYIDLEQKIGAPVDSTQWTLRFEMETTSTQLRTTNSAQVLIGLFDEITNPEFIEEFLFTLNI